MESLFNLITSQISSRIETEVKGALSPVAPYLRKLGIGLVVLIASSAPWATGLIFLLISLFFHFAMQEVNTHAALLTGLISILIGAVLSLIGILMLRRPRRS